MDFLDYSDLKNDERRLEHFTSLCGVLNTFLSDTLIPNPVELLGIYGRVCILQFMILMLNKLILVIFQMEIQKKKKNGIPCGKCDYFFIRTLSWKVLKNFGSVLRTKLGI